MIRNADGSVISVSRDQYTRIVEARAVEFAGLVRDGVIAARAGELDGARFDDPGVLDLGKRR